MRLQNRVANNRAWETKALQARKIRQVQHATGRHRKRARDTLTMPFSVKTDGGTIVFESKHVACAISAWARGVRSCRPELEISGLWPFKCLMITVTNLDR